jgi:hypothetical protein
MIFTAGRCVYGGANFVNDNSVPRNWYVDWLYFPGYTVDATGTMVTPYGGWAAVNLGSTPEWVASADPTQDIGVAIAETHAGVHLVNKVGGNGITWDEQADAPVIVYGYPVYNPTQVFNAPLQPCAGTYVVLSNLAVTQCALLPDATGGPWVVGYDSTGIGYLAGITSIVYPYISFMQSPYFSSQVLGLYNTYRSM